MIFIAEFHDLTCKMKHLKEVLKNPSTASGKKSYPTVTNSSCQALEIKNFQDICAVKRFIRECILNLTLIDHFLDGNDITTEKYRKKLQNALTRERVIGNTVVIQGLSTAANTFELVGQISIILLKGHVWSDTSSFFMPNINMPNGPPKHFENSSHSFHTLQTF